MRLTEYAFVGCCLAFDAHSNAFERRDRDTMAAAYWWHSLFKLLFDYGKHLDGKE